MEQEEDYVKATKSGRLYIKTSDFFRQKKIQATIEELLKSEIVKKIDQRKEAQLEKA